MGILEKAKILSNAGSFDSCGPKMCEVNINEGLGGIYHAKAEHSTCRIFKTLMSNACSFDCKYCGNAKGQSRSRAEYKPEELSSLFMHLHKNLDVNGLFLSSGVGKDPDLSTEKMLEAVRMLRFKYNFKGYIHFKILPGTSYELVKQASLLSDRLSINIEAPNKQALSELSTCKEYKIDILKRQAWISRMKLKSGQTTQLIVNRLSTDKDILKMMKWEYESFNMKRIYFSAFRPVKGTPLENEKEEPLSRQNHLYNADFLLRRYGFSYKELGIIMEDGMLPKQDPKLALAKATIEKAIDVNEAGYEELIRVPGIGPVTAKRIVERKEKIRKFKDLKDLGARINAAKPFIEIEGKRQATLGEF